MNELCSISDCRAMVTSIVPPDSRKTELGRGLCTILAIDQPGRVAAIATILFKLGLDIVETSVARLSNVHAANYLIAGPWAKIKKLSADMSAIESKLTDTAGPAVTAAESRLPYHLQMIADDKRGLLAEVACDVAKFNINIAALAAQSFMPKSGDRLAFGMDIKLEVPPASLPYLKKFPQKWERSNDWCVQLFPLD